MLNGQQQIAKTISAAPPEISFLSSVAEWREEEVLQAWHSLLNPDSHVFSMHQSPEWCEHLHHTKPQDPVFVVQVRDQNGCIAGLPSFFHHPVELKCRVKSRTLWTSRLKSLVLMGNQPLMKPEKHYYDALFSSLCNYTHTWDCVRIPMLPVDSYCWRYIQESPLIHRNYITYADSTSTIPLLKLPETFLAYTQQQFRPKKRSDLKRQVKLLQKAGDGELTLHRVEAKRDVADFLRRVDPVARCSWQARFCDYMVKDDAAWRTQLEDLAERGLLRAYRLSSGERTYAYIVGHQYNGVYHSEQTAYDPAFESYSTGTLLLYLMIQDLIENSNLTCVSWGPGASKYKQEFGNASLDTVSVYLLRKNLPNRLRHALHVKFRQLLQMPNRLASALRRSGKASASEAAPNASESGIKETANPNYAGQHPKDE